MEINDKLSNNNQKFNQGAEDFEIWFKNNKNIFMTEFKALEKMVTDPENCISIGIGNGLLAEKLGIKKGIEPSQAMAELARKKGIEVIEGRAKQFHWQREAQNRFCWVQYCLMLMIKERLLKKLIEY